MPCHIHYSSQVILSPYLFHFINKFLIIIMSRLEHHSRHMLYERHTFLSATSYFYKTFVVESGSHHEVRRSLLTQHLVQTVMYGEALNLTTMTKDKHQTYHKHYYALKTTLKHNNTMQLNSENPGKINKECLTIR